MKLLPLQSNVVNCLDFYNNQIVQSFLFIVFGFSNVLSTDIKVLRKWGSGPLIRPKSTMSPKSIFCTILCMQRLNCIKKQCFKHVTSLLAYFRTFFGIFEISLFSLCPTPNPDRQAKTEELSYVSMPTICLTNGQKKQLPKFIKMHQ